LKDIVKVNLALSGFGPPDRSEAKEAKALGIVVGPSKPVPVQYSSCGKHSFLTLRGLARHGYHKLESDQNKSRFLMGFRYFCEVRSWLHVNKIFGFEGGEARHGIHDIMALPAWSSHRCTECDGFQHYYCIKVCVTFSLACRTRLGNLSAND
jgi:hypothetical protein